MRAPRTTSALLTAALALGLGACGSSGGSKISTSSAPQGATAKVTVPNVTGQEAQFATARLQKLGLTPSTRKRYAPDAKGLVIDSNPPAGSVLARGTAIVVAVSRGPKPASQSAAAGSGSQTPSSGSASGSSGGSGSTGRGCPRGTYARADGSCGQVPQSNGGAPANTPQGQQQIQQNPDCKNAPPPPKGYKGPVQC